MHWTKSTPSTPTKSTNFAIIFQRNSVKCNVQLIYFQIFCQKQNRLIKTQNSNRERKRGKENGFSELCVFVIPFTTNTLILVSVENGDVIPNGEGYLFRISCGEIQVVLIASTIHAWSFGREEWKRNGRLKRENECAQGTQHFIWFPFCWIHYSTIRHEIQHHYCRCNRL